MAVIIELGFGVVKLCGKAVVEGVGEGTEPRSGVAERIVTVLRDNVA